MKKLLLSVFWISITGILQAQLRIGTGTRIRSAGGTYLVLDSVGIHNESVAIQLEPVVKFTGAGTAAISGSQSITFNSIQVDKTAGGQVRLFQHMNVSQSVSFNNGYIDLNGFETTLDAAATISGENVSAGFTGSGGGFVSITTNLIFPAGANPGNLGAIINAPANLGSTIIRRGHRSQTNGGGGGNSVYRFYDIIPANNTGLNATLRFFYRDEELNGLSESNLQLWKSTDNVNWFLQGFSARDIVANYVTLTGINSFSRWTLSSPGNTLPVSWGSIRLDCALLAPVLRWETLYEQNSMHFEVETSGNGNDWVKAGVINAAGNSQDKKSYHFTDLPGRKAAFYRIVQVDADGRRNSSSVIRNTCVSNSALQVWPNPVKQTLTVSVHSAVNGIIRLRLSDIQGTTILVSQRSVTAGPNLLTVEMEQLPPAIYHLQVFSAGEERPVVIPVVKE